MEMFHQSSHPLHLLEDLLASLSPGITATEAPIGQNPDDNNESPLNVIVADAAMEMAEAKQDVVLRAAGDLFGNKNMPLLENALALLNEQEKYQKQNTGQEAANVDEGMFPVIRKIRARRSGRAAILVRKQRKKTSLSSKFKYSDMNNISSSQIQHAKDKDGRNHSFVDGYYLCLLGRNQMEHRDLLATSDHQGWARFRRRGLHCTCRSFFQNMKGDCWSLASEINDMSSASTCPDVVVCKHSLAALIMPHLLPWNRPGGMEDEIVDDREFSKFVMRASTG